MHINRALLLVIGIVLMFFPAIEEWLTGPGATWYRPYQQIGRAHV